MIALGDLGHPGRRFPANSRTRLGVARLVHYVGHNHPSAEATLVVERTVQAPEVLGLDEREAFRDAALVELGQLASGRGVLVIDLAATRSMDSAGLGALLVIQRRAGERGIAVVLRHPGSEVRFLLMVTRLDGLFRIDPPAAPPA